MKLYLFAAALLTSITGFSQQKLYTPRDVQKAYKNGTRSLDGKPGKNYWQNKGRYKIDITAMPPSRLIKGAETISYVNNSPDTIKNPNIKLFLNIHKPGAARGQSTSRDYLTDGVFIDKVAVNGQARPNDNTQNTFTNFRLRLPSALLPGDSVQLSFDWHYDVSLQSGREGMIDSTTYFLAYFYPRVAVYDDYNGWDRMNFTDDHEFYSDFNDYDVSIHVPANYVVWGTGTLQQPEKLLQPAVLARFNESLRSDKTIRVASLDEFRSNNVTTQNATNTWQFLANNIPDMAFGLSNHFVWDAGSVTVDTVTGRRASVQAAYDNKSKDYTYVVGFAKEGLRLLSTTWPGIPYPYEKTTIFQGFAGMEYPMMANDESYPDTTFSKFVAEHEIAHTYMPFYMGINETRYGFMDEGWATTFELLLNQQHMGDKKAAEFYKQFRVTNWINDPNAEEDIPIITPGNVLTGVASGNNQYGKASLGYLAVKDMLGDVLFKKCLHAYMQRWNGKHPIPWDFFYTFNDVSGKNLNWFWSNWFFSNGYIDLAIEKAAKASGGYSVNLRNIGGFAAPVNVIVTYTDGQTETFHQTSAIWEKDQQATKVLIKTSKTISSIKLDGDIFMDADLSNNSYHL